MFPGAAKSLAEYDSDNSACSTAVARSHVSGLSPNQLLALMQSAN
jgi:hypothetical protein